VQGTQPVEIAARLLVVAVVMVARDLDRNRNRRLGLLQVTSRNRPPAETLVGPCRTRHQYVPEGPPGAAPRRPAPGTGSTTAVLGNPTSRSLRSIASVVPQQLYVRLTVREASEHRLLVRRQLNLWKYRKTFFGAIIPWPRNRAPAVESSRGGNNDAPDSRSKLTVEQDGPAACAVAAEMGTDVELEPLERG